MQGIQQQCFTMQGETGGAPAMATAARAPTTPPAMAPVFGPEPPDGPGLADATVWDPVRKPGQGIEIRLHDMQYAYMAKMYSANVIEHSFRCVKMVRDILTCSQVTSG